MKPFFKIACILFVTIGYSQKGIIHYGYIEALASGKAQGPDYNAYMVFDKEQSYYVTAKDSLEKAEKINEQKTYANEDGSGGTIHNGIKVSPQGDQVVYDVRKNTITSNFLYRKQVYVKEAATKLNWKIEKETKKLGTFTCTKATASFRGRNYTAWFAMAIPVRYGPWKLNGLPGLILEAYDSDKSVYWYFKSVEYPTKTKLNPISIRKSKKEKEVTFLTIEELKKFRSDEQQKVKEKNILLKKKFPEVEFEVPKQKEMFLEIE